MQKSRRTRPTTKRADAANARAKQKSGARQKRNPKKTAKRRRAQNAALKPIAIGLAFVLLLIIIVKAATHKNAFEVFIGSQSLGFIEKEKNITEEYITLNATAKIEEEAGTKIRLSEKITLTPVKAPKADLVTTDYILTKIKETSLYKANAGIIKADGAIAAILPSLEKANELIEEIKKEYVPEDKRADESGFKVDFVENVEVSEGYVNPDEIMTYEDALTKLTTGSTTEKPYTVQSGDSISKIASEFNMPVQKLLEINNMTIESALTAGQTLTTLVEKPFLSVKTTETVTYTEVLKKETQYQSDPSRPRDYKKVAQQGKDGQKRVTYNIIRINGFESEKIPISEEVTQEASPEIITVGEQ